MGALTAKQSHVLEPGKRKADFIWNALTILVLVGIVALGGCFITLYASPHSGLNPVSPAAAAKPDGTAEAGFAPALKSTSTAVADHSATQTDVPGQPTLPGPVTPTVGALEPTGAAEPSATPLGEAATFLLRNDRTTIASTVIHPDLGCHWAGVGGQVFDIQGRPLVQINVRLEGVLDGNPVDLLSMTGTQVDYGPAGYEFELGEKPVASDGTLTVQLVDPSGLPLSDKVSIKTRADCDANLVLVNFKQVK